MLHYMKMRKPIPKKIDLENVPSIGALAYELNNYKKDLVDTKNKIETDTQEALSEVKNTLSEKIQEADAALSTVVNSVEEIVEHVKTITQGERGADGKNGADAVLPKFDLEQIAKKAANYVDIKPTPASLKIIKEEVKLDKEEIVPMLNSASNKNELKLTLANITDWSETRRALETHSRRASGQVSGGGFNNIAQNGTIISTGLTTLNFIGATVTQTGSTVNVTVTGGGGTPGGNVNNVQLNDGSGGFAGSNSLTFDPLAGLVSIPGFTASDGLGNFASMSIFPGISQPFLSLGGAGTVPTYLNLVSGGGFTSNDIYLNHDISTLTVDRTATWQDKDGTVAYLSDIPSSLGTVTSVSVVTANGFAGTVATSTTTPAITIQTTLGVGQIPVSNGTGFQSAPLTGSGNIVLATSPTFSGATITTSTLNGVTLTTGGSATTYLNGAGAYTTPAGLTTLTVGSTTITSGTSTRILYDNAGVLGEYTITGSGTVVAMQTSPQLSTPDIGVATGTSLVLITNMNIGTAGQNTRLSITGNRTSTYYGVVNLFSSPGTFTDTSSSGTVATQMSNSFTQATFAASSSTTYTNAATIYIANAPVAGTNVVITNPYSLWIDAGVSRIDGDITFAPSDSSNIILGSTTGTKIGTATTQKLGFYNATPIVQPTGDVITALQNLGLGASLTISATALTGIVPPQNGGTGIANNSASTVTISGSFGTTITVSATTAVTLPTSGTLYGTATGSITSSQLATSLSDETGTGVAVFGTSPTFTTSILAAANTANIGSTTTGWGNLYLAATGTINVGNGSAVITGGTGTLTVSTGDLRITNANVGTNTTSVPTLGSTSTLTNKRITRRTATTNAPGATPTTNSDNVDVQIFTGLATAITSMTTNLSGTPTTGQFLEFLFVDNGTGRAITWGASFTQSGTVALPTTTVANQALRVLFEYQTTTSTAPVTATNTWVVVAVS